MNSLPWSDLALGASVLLAIGAFASVTIRSPHDRHRAGAATVLALLFWLGLALAPLPRFVAAGSAPEEDPAPPAAVTSVDRALPLIPAPESATGAVPVLAAPSSSTPPPPTPPPTPVDVRSLLVAAWLAGSCLALALLLLGHASLRRILHRSSTVEPEIDRLARATWDASGRPPRVLVSDRATRPFCCGVLRPTVVLPRALCAPRLRAGLVQVIRHELAHVRRGDLCVQTLFALAAVPFWWHPLLWWLRARTRFAAELVADEIASADDRRTYARDLLEVASAAPRAAHFQLPALSVFERESDFSRRMNMLLTRRDSLPVRSSTAMRAGRAAIALLAIAGTAGLFGRTQLSAQNPIQEVKETKDLLTKLNSVKATHRFDDAGLDDVAKFYSRLTGAVFLIDPSVRRLDSESTTLHEFGLEECSVADALDAITAKLGIHWGVRDGAVLLSDRPVTETSNAALERLIRKLHEARGERDAGAAQVAHPMDFDLLCRELGEPYADNIRMAIGNAGPGAAEKVVADFINLLAKQLEERPRAPDLDVAVPAPVQDAAPASNLAAIAELATRAIDARGELRAAEAAYARVKPLFETAAIDRSELERAEIRAQVAKDKLRALHTLVHAEREALAIELEATKAALDGLPPNTPRHTQLEARLRRLLGYVLVLDAAV